VYPVGSYYTVTSKIIEKLTVAQLCLQFSALSGNRRFPFRLSEHMKALDLIVRNSANRSQTVAAPHCRGRDSWRWRFIKAAWFRLPPSIIFPMRYLLTSSIRLVIWTEIWGCSLHPVKLSALLPLLQSATLKWCAASGCILVVGT
jgi:hypothetical protein